MTEQRIITWGVLVLTAGSVLGHMALTAPATFPTPTTPYLYDTGAIEPNADAPPVPTPQQNIRSAQT